jgi:prepilin-type N-terminal cleavage/methylation domain-containing protein
VSGSDDDSGLTLVELLIAIVVGGIVMSLIATIFITTMQATAATRDRDLATGRAQAISTSLTTSIRTATPVILEPATGGGSVLRARIATGASGWECRAWAVVDLETWDVAGRRPGADGRFELRARTYAPLTGTASSPVPTAAWGVLAEHVQQADDAGSRQPFFAIDGSRVTWNLVVSVSEEPQLNAQSLAAVAGSAVAQARSNGAATRC